MAVVTSPTQNPLLTKALANIYGGEPQFTVPWELLRRVFFPL